MNDLQDTQTQTAARFGVTPEPPEDDGKVGIARNVKAGLFPLNALRHSSQGDASGWFIWAEEELSSDPDFFVPVHISHLAEWCPQILPYLALPPGWRVLLAPGYEDVWFDGEIL